MDEDTKAREGKADMTEKWNAGERDTNPASLDSSKHEKPSKTVADHVNGAKASAHVMSGEPLQK